MIRIHLNSAGSDQSVGVKSVCDRGPPALPFHITKRGVLKCGGAWYVHNYHLTWWAQAHLCAYPNGLCVLTSTAQAELTNRNSVECALTDAQSAIVKAAFVGANTTCSYDNTTIGSVLLAT